MTSDMNTQVLQGHFLYWKLQGRIPLCPFARYLAYALSFSLKSQQVFLMFPHLWFSLFLHYFTFKDLATILHLEDIPGRLMINLNSSSHPVTYTCLHVLEIGRRRTSSALIYLLRLMKGHAFYGYEPRTSEKTVYSSENLMF